MLCSPTCLWNIWLQRNNNLFNNKSNIIYFNQTLTKLLNTSSSLSVTLNTIDPIIQSLLNGPLPPNIHTPVNTDTSFKTNPKNDGLGGIIRNHRGEWVLGFMVKIPHVNSTLVELQALRQRTIIGYKTQPHTFDHQLRLHKSYKYVNS